MITGWIKGKVKGALQTQRLKRRIREGREALNISPLGAVRPEVVFAPDGTSMLSIECVPCGSSMLWHEEGGWECLHCENTINCRQALSMFQEVDGMIGTLQAFLEERILLGIAERDERMDLKTEPR